MNKRDAGRLGALKRTQNKRRRVAAARKAGRVSAQKRKRS
jgi:hypothetical protein